MLVKQRLSLSSALAVVLAVTGSGWAQQQDAGATPAVTPLSSVAASAPAKGKKGKVEYTGPATVVELAPTPMLDEEGKQRLDPDGKPMFNPPVKQQRDKKGHPLFDEVGKPVMQTADNLGFDEKGKKLHKKKEKPPKTVSLAIVRGTMTVDGMTGKAALNYSIPDLKYIYLYVPGVGTTIVSNTMFPGAKEQPKAFDDKTLTVTVADHTLQVYSDTRMLGKKPEPAFVAVDREFMLPSKFPVMGYGTLRTAPYAWPGARQNKDEKAMNVPPLPENLRPVLLLEACPAGEMRMAGPKVLPGQVAPVQPCAPIASASASASTAKPAGANALK